MSSDADGEERPRNPAPKTKKGHRPCDMCRQKKRRCEPSCPDPRRCPIFAKVTEQKTTHRIATTNNSSRYNAYLTGEPSSVHSLEARLKTVEGILRGSNIVSTAGSPHASSDSTPDLDGPGVRLVTYALRGIDNPFLAPHSDDFSFHQVAESLQSLSLEDCSNRGFQGKSSQAMLIKAAVDLRSRAISPLPLPAPVLLPSKPWSVAPWENLPPPCEYSFPPEDLTIHLVSLYFSNINIYFPLLHRPTFETDVATDIHLSNEGFARTLLLVCALGARYSDDARVHLPPPSGTAGWKWFEQVKLTLSGQPTLYDLQCHCLAVQFLERISGPRAAWTLVGFGVRLAQDIAAHRRKPLMRTITAEEELEKRAYWIMFLFDTQLSVALGRTIATQGHDFDLDLPVRSEDEYWEASPRNAAFGQPRNKPSSVDFFNCHLRLDRILSFALKILYATNRSKTLLGLDDDGWEEKVVKEFDSAVNKWLDCVPEHLRWDPARTNDLFFDQSAALYCNYYLTRILIHRPFIPAIRPSEGPMTFLSLTICNHAARACIHVVEAQYRRRPNNPLLFGQTALFTSGIVLLLNIWGANRGGRVQDADLSDVRRCMDLLRAYTRHWSSARALLNTLEQLLKVDQPQPVRVPQESESSPFVQSGSRRGDGTSSIRPSSWNGDLGVPNSDSAFSWPAYDPALETDDSSYIPLNDSYGPDSAPVRASNAEYPIFTGGSAISLPDPSPFPDVVGNRTQRSENIADMHMDTVAIWSDAPSGFEVSDWDLYLASIGHK
ncbi:fungal-specific transcription factor domain-containing protein [Mycena olivaceomarginata]|nr:fungal-specific transcription factor domain-containing protein [Mycena olivaceomarginata]